MDIRRKKPVLSSPDDKRCGAPILNFNVSASDIYGSPPVSEFREVTMYPYGEHVVSTNEPPGKELK